MIKIKLLKKYNTTETLPANIRKKKKKKKNRATNYRFRYRGTNSVGQPYES